MLEFSFFSTSLMLACIIIVLYCHILYVCRYWHRSLNPRKLIEVKFSHLSRNMTMQRTMKLYRLPEVHTDPASTFDSDIKPPLLHLASSRGGGCYKY